MGQSAGSRNERLRFTRARRRIDQMGQVNRLKPLEHHLTPGSERAAAANRCVHITDVTGFSDG